jgi:hypothetical protein
MAKPPGIELTWFADKADLERFFDCVTKAYGAVQSITGMSGIATGDMKKAVLLDHIVCRMLKHHQDRALERLDDKLAADFAHHADAIWPLFRDTIDETMAEATKAFESLLVATERKH